MPTDIPNDISQQPKPFDFAGRIQNLLNSDHIVNKKRYAVVQLDNPNNLENIEQVLQSFDNIDPTFLQSMKVYNAIGVNQWFFVVDPNNPREIILSVGYSIAEKSILVTRFPAGTDTYDGQSIVNGVDAQVAVLKKIVSEKENFAQSLTIISDVPNFGLIQNGLVLVSSIFADRGRLFGLVALSQSHLNDRKITSIAWMNDLTKFNDIEVVKKAGLLQMISQLTKQGSSVVKANETKWGIGNISKLIEQLNKAGHDTTALQVLLNELLNKKSEG